MDSLSQIALGAAVGIATMGRRTAPWKAALWGAVCGTLPDLDVVLDHGDAVRNMTLHRAESHSLFWLSVLSPALASAIATLHGERALFRRWWLAVWLMLITHPLLDFMTVYGTQIGLPFTAHPFGVGSIFIIDPLYTVPLIVGVVAALSSRKRGLRWNEAALVLSTAYLAWSFAAQQWVRDEAEEELARQGIGVRQVLVTPTPFNTVLWRIVAISADGTYREGFRSLLDRGDEIRFDAFPRGDTLRTERLHGNGSADRLAAFTHGFYKVSEEPGRLLVTDLRMGQEPAYSFAFVVAREENGRWIETRPVNEGRRPADVPRMFRWLGARALGEPAPPPR